MAVLTAFSLLLVIVCMCEAISIDKVIQAVKDGSDGKQAFVPKVQGNDSVVKFQLDLLFTFSDYQQLNISTSRRQKRKAWRHVIRRWPGRVIPYRINSAEFTSTNMTEFRKAVAEWEQYTCLRFRSATAADQRGLDIKSVFGCSSYVGMQLNQPQELNLADGCRLKHIISHELGHAIGFIHEQSRPDRDGYVTIDYSNVRPGWEKNFQKFTEAKINIYGIPYDYRSLMHYGKDFLSMSNAPTIKTTDPTMQNVIGEAEVLSFHDIKAANLMYQCNENCSLRLSCTGDGFLGKDCKCWHPGSPIIKREPLIRPPNSPIGQCQPNYTVYLPFDDFTDRSCRNKQACAIGNPSPTTNGIEKVMAFDGKSYLELPSFNMRNDGHIQQMTIVVRFKVTTKPQDFAVILSNGEIDTMPTLDVHINNQNNVVAGINGVYFNEQQISRDWTTVKIVFNRGRMTLFINGQNKESKNPSGDSIQNTQFPLRIGGGSNGFIDGFLNGFIDKVEISEQAMAA